MPVKLNSTGGGSVTLDVGSTASNFNLTLPSANATVLTNRSAGTILQVVSTTKTDTWSETTSGSGGITGNITGLSATITPSNASNRILILLQLTFSSSQTTHNINTFLYRNGTQIALADANGVQFRATTGQGQANQSGENMSNSNVSFLDSPATTSAVTYTVRLSTGLANVNTIYLNRSPNDSNFNYIARGTSTITVMEVAA